MIVVVLAGGRHTQNIHIPECERMSARAATTASRTRAAFVYCWTATATKTNDGQTATHPLDRAAARAADRVRTASAGDSDRS